MQDATQDEDDVRPITLREPREAWRANLFWGALVAGVLLVPALLSDDGGFERLASLVTGSLALLGFTLMAVQNRARLIRCDATHITVEQPVLGRRIALHDVKSVTRKDLRKRLRQLRDIGHPKHKPRQLDTMAEVVIFVLRDRNGGQLLVLNRDLEPKHELQRLLRRLERRSGTVVRDEN